MPTMLIALPGGDGLVMCAYMLQFKLFIELELEFHIFLKLF